MGQPIFVTGATPLLVYWLTKRLMETAGADIMCLVRKAHNQTNEIKHQYLSAKKARKMLNWAPLHTLEVGLKRTTDRYKQFLGAA